MTQDNKSWEKDVLLKLDKMIFDRYNDLNSDFLAGEVMQLIHSTLNKERNRLIEKVAKMDREGGELHPYLEIVKTKNMDKMFDYGYEKCRSDILSVIKER